MFRKFLLIFLFCLTIDVNCEPNQNDLISINNKLALDLLNTFPTDKNNFFSPISITTALLMVMNGANGSTQQEFRQLFNFDEKYNFKQINTEVKTILKTIDRKESQNLIIRLANLILTSNDFPMKKDYQKVMSDMFDSSVEAVNFHNNSRQITNDINEWVSQQTNRKINNVFDEDLSANTVMVLLNAIYFKGMWKYLFDKKDTQKGGFFDFGREETILVDMMTMKRRFKIKNVDELDAKMFEMPFVAGSDMSMIIMLPNKIDGLDEMTRKLSLKTLNETIREIRKRRGLTNTLIFPKFKIESEYNLKDSLQKLGLKSMFEDSADLSEINGKRNLKVSKAIHKGYIEINEEGAEAAAVTKFVVVLRTFRQNLIAVDRPFMFAIVDQKSGLILFLGQIRSLS